MRNRITYIFILLLGLGWFSSCKEESIGTQSDDSVPPGKVTSPRTIRQYGGGVTIQYDIPGDNDLLYVKAVYTLDNGEAMEVSSSLYHNELDIVGFSNEGDKEIQLIAVDRSKNESEPVPFTIHPYDSPIHAIMNSLQIYGAFGGLELNWENPEKENIVIMLTQPREPGSPLYERVKDFYSSSAKVQDYVFDLPAGETPIRVQIRDRWGNLTQSRDDLYEVLFEEECVKGLFSRWNGDPGIPYHAYNNTSYPIEKLWDKQLSPGSTTSIWHTAAATTLPEHFTFDLGATYNLSRITVWQRVVGVTHSFSAPQYFRIFGSASASARLANDNDNSMDPMDDRKWKLLLTCESFKPSGLPVGECSAEDIQFASVDGQNYMLRMEQGMIPVRYIRFTMDKAWDNAMTCVLAEMSLFGKKVE